MSEREQQAAGPVNFYKVGDPYEIDGKRYHPKEDYKYKETGIASWYGDEFHGRPTANGEVFNMNAVSAAHRTLPMPSVVRVTNLENGRSMVVRVNDRGPFVKDRILDMSHHGADLLGYRGKGTAKVRVEILADESRKMKEAALRGQRITTAQLVDGAEEDPEMPALAPATGVVEQTAEIAAPSDDPYRLAALDPAAGVAAAQSGAGIRRIFVQTGAYTVFDNAVRAQGAVDMLAPATITPIANNGLRLYRVRLGPFAASGEADSALEQAIKRGYAGARIVAD